MAGSLNLLLISGVPPSVGTPVFDLYRPAGIDQISG